MYDDTCRFLAEHFSADFASWLLGESVTLTEIKPSELSLDPIRADALILLQSDESVLHLEFQTRPDPDIPFRMFDYRARVYRRYRNKTMRQVVIYLKQTRSDLVQQTSLTLERTRHDVEVVRLWEQPDNLFLQYPRLIPFAAMPVDWMQSHSVVKQNLQCDRSNLGECQTKGRCNALVNPK